MHFSPNAFLMAADAERRLAFVLTAILMSLKRFDPQIAIQKNKNTIKFFSKSSYSRQWLSKQVKLCLNKQTLPLINTSRMESQDAKQIKKIQTT